MQRWLLLQKELRTNKVLIKIEQSIVKYILGNLELFDGEIVDSILLWIMFIKRNFPRIYISRKAFIIHNGNCTSKGGVLCIS